MDVLIRLYNMVNPAADGSVISREVTEEYLKSEDYRTIIRDKIALGGKTHVSRAQDELHKGTIGPDDELLLQRNSLFYIKKIFTKPDSDFCWAVITIYDPDEFSGTLRDEIINLRGMLKSGTKLPCSVVIQAVWSPTNQCLKIIRIKGVDFTLNPSFAGSGTERLMSVTVETDEAETRMYSADSGFRTGVRRFSFETESTEQIQAFSEKDVILTFGRNSEEYKIFSQLRRSTDSGIVTKDQLSKAVSALNTQDTLGLEDFLKILSEFVTPENKTLFVSLCNQGIGKLQQLVNQVPKSDPDYEELIKVKLIDYLSTLPKGDKLFSLSSIPQDRLRILAYDKLLQPRFLTRIYKLYYEQSQQSLTVQDKIELERLFVSDWMILVKEAIPSMKQGISISAYYQLSAYNPELSQIGRLLSFYYRRLLISEEILGYIPVRIYEYWTKYLSEFLTKLIEFTFGSRLSSEPLSFIK